MKDLELPRSYESMQIFLCLNGMYFMNFKRFSALLWILILISIPALSDDSLEEGWDGDDLLIKKVEINPPPPPNDYRTNYEHIYIKVILKKIVPNTVVTLNLSYPNEYAFYNPRGEMPNLPQFTKTLKKGDEPFVSFDFWLSDVKPYIGTASGHVIVKSGSDKSDVSIIGPKVDINYLTVKNKCIGVFNCNTDTNTIKLYKMDIISTERTNIDLKINGKEAEVDQKIPGGEIKTVRWDDELSDVDDSINMSCGENKSVCRSIITPLINWNY